MAFASVYPHYIAKAEKKGTKGEVHAIIHWLTGYAAGADTLRADGLTLFTALREQLGLRLDSSRAAVRSSSSITRSRRHQTKRGRHSRNPPPRGLPQRCARENGAADRALAGLTMGELTKHFVRVPETEWRINGTDEASSKLHYAPEYEHLVHVIASTATVAECRRESLTRRPAYHRAVVRFAVGTDLVNLFHSAATGYRAQYYASPEIGNEANTLMVRALGARAVALLASRSKRTCPLEWLSSSLEESSAKVWIHQGVWLRHARCSDERLRVERWIRHRDDVDVKLRRKARWAALIPDSEGFLELKGGFISHQGAGIVALKPRRARELHEHGFT